MMRTAAAPLGMVLLSILALGWTVLAPGGGDGPLLAIFPPSFDRAATYRAVSSTAVQIVADGALENSVVVKASADDFAALHRAGAVLLLDSAMLAGCDRARTGS